MLTYFVLFIIVIVFFYFNIYIRNPLKNIRGGWATEYITFFGNIKKKSYQ